MTVATLPVGIVKQFNTWSSCLLCPECRKPVISRLVRGRDDGPANPFKRDEAALPARALVWGYRCNTAGCPVTELTDPRD